MPDSIFRARRVFHSPGGPLQQTSAQSVLHKGSLHDYFSPEDILSARCSHRSSAQRFSFLLPLCFSISALTSTQLAECCWRVTNMLCDLWSPNICWQLEQCVKIRKQEPSTSVATVTDNHPACSLAWCHAPGRMSGLRYWMRNWMI